VVVGWDARGTSPKLAQSLIQGVMDEGATVLDIGLAGTEEMYWATSYFQADGGIEVTASHNPINYNGLKMVKAGSKPLDPATELLAVQTCAEDNNFGLKKLGGHQFDRQLAAKQAYVEKVLSFVAISDLRPLKIVVNCGNGAAGPTFDALAHALSARTDAFDFIRVFHTPDSSFPNGIPNPLLTENHAPTRDQVLAHKADLGIAFDGDFDRCFFFDAQGLFIPGEYIVGLLASVFLEKEPGAKIVHDPRVVWNTKDIVQINSGMAVQSKTGHAFIKQVMREFDAVYGGEMSAHHYFRDFAYCDSGMIPWLVLCELMGRSGQPLSALVAARMADYPSSGETNFTLQDPQASIAKVLAVYEPKALQKDQTDGVSLEFDAWRFNLRASNTEPVVRLNIESRGDPSLVATKLDDITRLLQS
jgi:phosphomannomutase